MINRLELEDVKDVIYKSISKGAVVYKKVVKNHEYAIKKVKINHQCHRPDQELRVCNQIKNLQNLPQNLVEIVDCWEREDSYYIMMQYYPLTLQKYLVEKSEKMAAQPHIPISIFIQICHGMLQLRKLLRCHRDLKTSNIFIRELGDQVKVVLADFGVCNQGEYLNSSRVGTNFFMAPQIKAINLVRYYDNRVDIWSLGIILFQIFAAFESKINKIPQFPELCSYLEKPTLNKNQLEEMAQMMEEFKPQINKKVPEVIRKIMQIILEMNHQKRLRLQQIGEYLFANRKIIQIYFRNKPVWSEISKKIQVLCQQIDHNFIEIEKVRSLHQQFYLPLLKVKFESNPYITFYLFLYHGLTTVRKFYENNRKKMKEEILIQHVFTSKGSMQSMMRDQLILKNRLNSKYSDQQLNDHYNRRHQLVNKASLKTFLLKYFSADDVERLFDVYSQI